jgi:peptidoglycan L-alanyl-D-glutamate endopeptidase CwlK
METLREGSRGPDVQLLQRRLTEKGFKPGEIDGIFGAGTEAAVLAFQRSKGILADGIVGRETAAALDFVESDLPVAEGMPGVTVQIAAKMVPGAPLANIKSNLPLIMGAMQNASLTTKPIALTAIATAMVETGRFEPISEFPSRFNTSPGGGELFDLYDFRTDIGNNARGDGAKYKGRGFVQLTGQFNYLRFGPQVGVDLIADPERANDPQIAAQLLAAFLGAHRLRIEQALLEGDFSDARKAVNGGSHGLGDFTESYKTGLQLLS